MMMNGGLKIILAMIVTLAACTPASSPTAAPSGTAAPTSTPRPTPTPNPFPDPVLKIVGPEEVVFDWTTDKCERMNIPDLPVRALRGADDQVQLIISDIGNYRMLGSDLNSVRPDCRVIMGSAFNADPAMHEDSEWLAAPYTDDGQTIYAVVHDEYHGWEHPGQCTERGYFPPCWYNTLTLAVSTDGGSSYSHAAEPPAHFIAGLPYVYEQQNGAAGIRAPSNLVRGQDGFYYQVANVTNPSDSQQWMCLMRTSDVSDPKAWRFWNGTDFSGTFVDPYAAPPANPLEHVCPAMDPEGKTVGGTLVDSLTYNTYLSRYVLVGMSADHLEGREVWGIYYSFSTDMINWTRRKLLVEMVLPWTAAHNDDVMYLYPSLLDPQSDSRSFETTGKTGYVYYTRFNRGQGYLDRDLIRVPVEFFPKP